MEYLKQVMPSKHPTYIPLLRIEKQRKEAIDAQGKIQEIIAAAEKKQAEAMSAIMVSPTVANFEAFTAARWDHLRLCEGRNYTNALFGSAIQEIERTDEANDIFQNYLELALKQVTAKQASITKEWAEHLAEEGLTPADAGQDHPAIPMISDLVRRISTALEDCERWREDLDCRASQSPMERHRDLLIVNS
jgi:hypothetical protein